MLHRQPLVLVIFFAFVAITSSCRAPNRNTQRGVTTWGTMREVLRQGKSEGRVALANIATPHTIGVGALEGLAGEVTIVDGRVLVASATIGNDDANGVALGRDATDTDRAALLVLGDVPARKEIEGGVCGGDGGGAAPGWRGCCAAVTSVAMRPGGSSRSAAPLTAP